jgi:two-component system, sensor histidine kinase and response regulator
MNDHVAKPIDPDQLFKSLTTWIAPGERAPSSVEAPARAALAEAGSSLPDGLPGIDMAKALKGLGGDTALLRKILLSFLHDHQGDALAMRRALVDNDMRLAQRIAHTLKGVSGSIGAMELHPAATALDDALKNGATDRYPDLLDTLESVLASVIDGLSSLGEQGADDNAAEAVTGPPDIGMILPLLAELAGLVREMDPDAEIAADALRRKVGAGPARPLADELVAQLAKFDFDAAGQTLARLREALAASS